MVRFVVVCALMGGMGTVGIAAADDQVNTGSRFQLPALPKVPDRVQQLRIDATANQPDTVKDPFQGFNRQVYRFNDALDRRILLPTAKFYQRAVPKPINTGISNFFQNISEPWTAVNQLLQGKPKASAQSLGRFGINTLTSLGFADPATHSLNLRAGDEDFGQTLGVWGVKSGPYLMLPLFGPSTLRDATAKIVDMAASPSMYVEPDQARIALTVTNVVDTREKFIGAESIVTGDQYPVLRDVYLQRRLFQVFDGAPPARLNPPVEEGFGDEEEELNDSSNPDFPEDNRTEDQSSPANMPPETQVPATETTSPETVAPETSFGDGPTADVE